MADRTCSIDGCDDVHEARGWCSKHYQRYRKHGDPLHVEFIRSDNEARFWSYVDKDGPGGCWLWTGGLHPNGYGGLIIDGRAEKAHRFAYELLVGPIPAGLVIDHVHARGCRHKNCVNPAHLEAVTGAENTRRAAAVARSAA